MPYLQVNHDKVVSELRDLLGLCKFGLQSWHEGTTTTTSSQWLFTVRHSCISHMQVNGMCNHLDVTNTQTHLKKHLERAIGGKNLGLRKIDLLYPLSQEDI